MIRRGSCCRSKGELAVPRRAVGAQPSLAPAEDHWLRTRPRAFVHVVLSDVASLTMHFSEVW